MSNKKSHGGHGLMMLICCLVMFGGFWFVGISDSGGTNTWNWLFLLLCPLMHIFMMKGHHGHQHDDDNDQDNQSCH